MARNYEFTVDWTSQNTDVWLSMLAPLINRPGLRFLEVGSFEGRSAAWFLDNILLDPTSLIVCIDTFEGSAEHAGMKQVLDLENRFLRNMERHNSKVRPMRGRSSELLRMMLPNPEFDLVYIDGAHESSDVLTDAVLSWPLLRPTGFMIFDDYLWDLPGPKIAVDAFVSAYSGLCEVKYKGYQVILTKR